MCQSLNDTITQSLAMIQKAPRNLWREPTLSKRFAGFPCNCKTLDGCFLPKLEELLNDGTPVLHSVLVSLIVNRLMDDANMVSIENILAICSFFSSYAYGYSISFIIHHELYKGCLDSAVGQQIVCIPLFASGTNLQVILTAHHLRDRTIVTLRWLVL